MDLNLRSFFEGLRVNINSTACLQDIDVERIYERRPRPLCPAHLAVSAARNLYFLNSIKFSKFILITCCYYVVIFVVSIILCHYYFVLLCLVLSFSIPVIKSLSGP